jgi:hypothetical protein
LKPLQARSRSRFRAIGAGLGRCLQHSVPATGLTFPVSGKGLSGSVAFEPYRGYFVFQFLEFRILEHFLGSAPHERPDQDRISFRGPCVLGKQSVAFCAKHWHNLSPLQTTRFVMATVRSIFFAVLMHANFLLRPGPKNGCAIGASVPLSVQPHAGRPHFSEA